MKCSQLESTACQVTEGSGLGPVFSPCAQLGGVAASHCERCSGLLYWTELREWDGSRGQDCHGALQCILCGNVIDPVIVKNRERARNSVREAVRSSGRRWRRMLAESVVELNKF